MPTPRQWCKGRAPLMLAALALAGFLLDAGSVPHVHVDDGAAFFNLEHDLSYLATFNTGAPLPVAVSLAALAVLVTMVAMLVVARPFVFAAGLKDSRAPPA